MWRALPVPEGELFAWQPDSTYVRHPPYFEGMPHEPGTVGDIDGARCLVWLGDSVTTDHISPAGSIKPDSPAGAYLVEHGVERKDFNSYGARRGNHEVMVRGTFANVRLRNKLVPESEGTWTVHVPSGEEMTIYDASQRYLAEGTPLVVLAGKEYGSGSSRDWAAKGPNLLGVKAVIAESYERIHRSNLLMMGVLPLQFMDGESAASLGLTGREAFSIDRRRQRRSPRGDGARGRQGVPRPGSARHAARARVPAARRDPAVRAAAPARLVGELCKLPRLCLGRTTRATEAARRLGISLDTLRRWDRDGLIHTSATRGTAARSQPRSSTGCAPRSARTESARATASSGPSRR